LSESQFVLSFFDENRLAFGVTGNAKSGETGNSWKDQREHFCWKSIGIYAQSVYNVQVQIIFFSFMSIKNKNAFLYLWTEDIK